MPFIRSEVLFRALKEAGVFSEEDDARVRRFVIDASVGDAVRLYVERIGDHSLVELLPELLKGLTETTPESLREEISALRWERDELAKAAV